MLLCFLNLTVFHIAGPALNLPFLLDHIMTEIQPLNWQAVVDSPVPLKVLTPDYQCKQLFY